MAKVPHSTKESTMAANHDILLRASLKPMKEVSRSLRDLVDLRRFAMLVVVVRRAQPVFVVSPYLVMRMLNLRKVYRGLKLTSNFIQMPSSIAIEVDRLSNGLVGNNGRILEHWKSM